MGTVSTKKLLILLVFTVVIPVKLVKLILKIVQVVLLDYFTFIIVILYVLIKHLMIHTHVSIVLLNVKIVLPLKIVPFVSQHTYYLISLVF